MRLFHELALLQEKNENYINPAIFYKNRVGTLLYIKELFALDGKKTNLSENDVARRNTIANLLSDWGLVSVVGKAEPVAPLSQIKVLSFREKAEWTLETKYNIGKKKEA